MRAVHAVWRVRGGADRCVCVLGVLLRVGRNVFMLVIRLMRWGISRTAEVCEKNG